MKKSFIIHVDSLDILDELTDQQAGQLFKLIREYHNPNIPKQTEITQMVNLAFFQFKNQFQRDLQKYDNILERNKINGKLGGRPKKINPNKPKKADSDSDSDNVSDNVNDSVSVKDKKEKYNFSTALINYGFDSDLVKDWLVVRKNKKCSNTETAFKGFISQVEKTNMDKNFVLKKCIERSWGGFDADWLKNITPEYKKPMYWHFKFRNNLGTYYTPDPVPEEQGEAFKQQQFLRIDKPQLIEEYLKPQSWRN